MPVKSKRKSKPQSKNDAAKARARPSTDAARLEAAIRDLIDSKHRGDDRASAKATGEIRKFRQSSGTGQLRQAAIEAEAVAGNPGTGDSVRRLTNILDIRLKTGT